VANLPPVSITPAANFATNFASVVDTCGKFSTGVNDMSLQLLNSEFPHIRGVFDLSVKYAQDMFCMNIHKTFFIHS
jgi:hypothetical protein